MTKDSQQSYQYIYIDDSGDPGFKIARNSSKYLVIAGVFFERHEDMERVDKIVQDLKMSLKWKQDYEFKFHKTSDRERVIFLETVRNLGLSIHVGLSKKDIGAYHDAFELYNRTILRVVEQATAGKRLMIRIDGEAGDNYIKKARTYFRKTLSGKSIKSFIYIDSKKSNLIQLADMVVGAVAAYYNKGNPRYLQIIKKSIQIHQ